MTPLKKCTKCGEEKPATTEFFSRHKDGKYGLRPDCLICRNNNRRTDEYRKKVRIYIQSKRKPKEMVVCPQCGLQYVRGRIDQEYCSRRCSGLRYKAVNKDTLAKKRQIYFKKESVKERVRQARRQYYHNNKSLIKEKRKLQVYDKDKNLKRSIKWVQNNPQQRRLHANKYARKQVNIISRQYAEYLLKAQGLPVTTALLSAKRTSVKAHRLITKIKRKYENQKNI